MKTSSVIAVAATVAASFVSAQLASIPACALSCAISSLGSTSCAQTDIKCICQASGFIAALQPCVEKACSPADLQATIVAAQGLCASAGVSLSIPSAGGAASTSAPASTSSAPASTSAVATTSAAAATTTLSTVVTTSSVVVVVPTVAANTTTTVAAPTPSSNATVVIPTTALPTASPTGNAAGRNTVAVGGFAVILAFAAALL